MRADLVLVAAIAIVGTGCDVFGFGPCPEPPRRALEPGTYQTKRPPTPSADLDPGFAHAGTGQKTMVIDRASNRIDISYERAGKQVHEVWRIKSAAYEEH